MTETPPFDLSGLRIKLVESADDAHNFIEWMKTVQTPVMGVDVETSGLQWYSDKLRLVQFGSFNAGWAVPFEWYPRVVLEAMQIIDRRRLPIVGHNFRFDLHYIDKNTDWVPTQWGNYHDTMNLAAVLNSSGDKSLKGLSEIHVSRQAKDFQRNLDAKMHEHKWTWGTVPIQLPEYWIYGIVDTILNAHLFAKLYRLGSERGTLEAYGNEAGAVPTLYAMEKKGMLVDTEHCQHQLAILRNRMREIELEADDFGIDNIGSNDQLVRAFLDTGVELVTKTETGRWSMSKEAFEELEEREGKHPLVALVSEYRKSEKFVGSYYENFLKYQHDDGRVHPAFRQVVAKTGRMSAQYPAVQTIPRHETDPNVRNSFIAPDGHVLIATDFTNIEARIFAHFAEEQGMLQAIRDGIDLHGYTAQQVYHEWPETGVAPKDHPKRQVAKNTLFCMLFGGGAGKVAKTAHVSLEEAQDAFDGVHKAFPGIKTFQKRAESAARINLDETGQAWIRGVDGRILAMAQSDDRYYAFTNWIIQGTATVLLKQRLAVIHQMGLSDYCVSTIHDEVVAEVPEGDAEDFRHEIEEAMLDETQFAVPAVAEAGKPAKRLGDAK